MWMRLSLYYDVGCLGAPLVHFRRHRDSESFAIEGTIAEVEQEVLAKYLVLSDHGHRIADADKLKKRIGAAVSHEEIARARSAFSAGRSAEGWSRLRSSIKLRPGVLLGREFAGTLLRIVLGPRAFRWVKSALLREKG